MFCPKCKNEYREGIAFCPDCNCSLVDELSETQEPLLSLKSKTLLDRFTAYLDHSGLVYIVEPNESTGKYDLYCERVDNDRIMRAFSVFVSVETGRAFEQSPSAGDTENLLTDISGDLTVDPDSVEELEKSLEEAASENEALRELYSEDAVQQVTAQPMPMKHGTREFVSAAEKAEEAVSTAKLFTVFGIGGILVLAALIAAGVLTLDFGSVVMFLVFIAMIAVGSWSKSQARGLSEQQSSEDQLIGRMRDFLHTDFTADSVSEKYPDPESGNSDEMNEIHLLRMELIRSGLSEHFPDASEELIVELTDEHYSEIFPEA